MKKNIGDFVVDLRRNNQGRPLKISFQQNINILQQTKLLKEDMGNFCVKRVMVKASIPPSISEKTFQRVLRKTELKWARVQRERILTKNDMKLRLRFARKVRCKLSANFWKEGAGFYLDGTNFTHKTTPFEQARAPRVMAWRKPGPGIDISFTGKGGDKSTGENFARFMAAVAYGKDVIAAEQ